LNLEAAVSPFLSGASLFGFLVIHCVLVALSPIFARNVPHSRTFGITKKHGPFLRSSHHSPTALPCSVLVVKRREVPGGTCHATTGAAIIRHKICLTVLV